MNSNKDYSKMNDEEINELVKEMGVKKLRSYRDKFNDFFANCLECSSPKY